MAKWQRRLDQMLKDEKEKHKAVYELFEKIKSEIHSETNIDIEYIKEKVNKLCEKVELIDSYISNVRVEYAYDEDKPQHLLIRVNIDGDFKGIFIIETIAGTVGKMWSNENRQDSYYVATYNCGIESHKEERARGVYKTFTHHNIDLLVDLALDKNWYVKYDGRYESYEIWDSEPSRYDDVISGYMTYRRWDNPKTLFKMNQSLKALHLSEDVEKTAKEKLDGELESVTYEWNKYSL